MKSLVAVLLFFICAANCAAQNVAINATGISPDTSAMLDVASSNKGMLIPQVSISTLTDAATIAVPAHSLLIYNTNASLPGGKGYYYNAGTTGSPAWTKLTAASDQFTMGSIGASPNANGATISGNTLTLQPASETYGGIITTGMQTIAGMKTFTDDLVAAGRLMVPMGEISYFSTTGTTVSITTVSNGSSNMVKAAPETIFVNDMEFDNGGSNNGTLRYIGTTTRFFHIACTVSFAPGGGSAATYVFGVAKNGTVLTSSKVLQRLTNSSTDINSTALHVAISLSTNDSLTFMVGNLTSTGDIKMHSINMFALGM